MKRIKRIAAVVMAAIMALAMSITAFASETKSEPTISGQTYNIYQVFTGDYSDGVLSNVRWGKNGTGYDATKPKQDLVSEDILKELQEARGETDDTAGDAADVAQLKVIEKYVIKPLKNQEPVATGTKTTYTGLIPGYYLVSGTVTFNNVNQDDPNGTTSAETLYVVRVTDGTLTFAPKVGVPTVTKKIDDNNQKVDTNEASIGDNVSYEIVGTMPSNIEAFETYTYMFKDTLSKGLTFNGFDTKKGYKVTVNGEDATKYFYTEISKDENGATKIEVSIQDLKSLETIVGKITSATSVVLTYTAELNQDAEIAGDGNKNDVELKYSNDPNKRGDGTPSTPDENPKKPTEPDGVTPKDEVVTYTTELAILKTDENGEILKGAEFTLTGDGVKVGLVTRETFVPTEKGAYWKLKNGSYTTIAPTDTDDETNNTNKYDLEAGKFDIVRTVVPTDGDRTTAVAIIDDDGRITFTGLGAGKYTISESNTPAGYNTIADIVFTVSFDPDTKTFSADNDISLGANNTLETTIVNKKGSLLPSTGGIGTTIFYIVGAILVIGAGVILVAKKRMSREV